MAKFDVCGVCFRQFPYVSAVFLAGLRHSAPALTSGVFSRVPFRFGGVPRNMLVVCGACGSSFAFISDQNTPSKIFATTCNGGGGGRGGDGRGGRPDTKKLNAQQVKAELAKGDF